jgi:transposase
LAIARILEAHVADVALAHAKQVRAISHARVKTDKVDAKVLAALVAAGLIPAVWIGDERARVLRRLVSRRRGLVKPRTQLKNEISAVLHRNFTRPQPGQRPVRQEGPRVDRGPAAAHRRTPDRRRVPAPAGARARRRFARARCPAA